MGDPAKTAQPTDDEVIAHINKKRAAQEEHARKAKERAEQLALIKAEYLKAKDSPVIADILAKVKSFSDYHVKLAQDGVGYRSTGHKLEDGSPEQEIFYFTHEQRVTHLDKSAGLLELADYIERQLAEDVKPTVTKPKK